MALRPRRRRLGAVVDRADRTSLIVASAIAGAAVTISWYVSAFPPDRVRNLGSDASGYIVQMRAASAGVLDLQASRPGVGVLGASVAGTGLVPVEATPVVLSVALTVCIGVLAAAALRTGYATPGWAFGVAVVFVAAWGGTARLASGYLANLESLTLFLLAMVLATIPGEQRRTLAMTVAFTASLLAHPSLLPAYGAILIGWWAVSLLPAGTGPRSEGSPPAVVAAAFSLASLLAIAILGGWIGLRLSDLQDFSLIGDQFGRRVAENLEWIGLTSSILMIVAGTVVTVVRRDAPRSWSMGALGGVWLLVSAAGVLLVALIPRLPGHRTLLLGIPAPMLGALAVAGVAYEVTRRIRRAGPMGTAARALVVASAVAIALGSTVSTHRLLESEARADLPGVNAGPAAVASYLRAIEDRRPVVIVIDPPGAAGIRFWKARQNTVRSLAPDDVFLDVVTYLGDERLLLRGAPTRRTGDRLFDLASDRTWPSVRDRLPEDPIVLVVRPWVTDTVWERVTRSAALASPLVAVVRGPLAERALPTITATELTRGAAAWRIGLLVLVLGIAGGGWSLLALRRRGSVVDVFGIAPALGVAVVVLVGLAVTLVGGDPGGAWGLGIVAGVTAVGWGGAVRAARAASPEPDA
jgi:hypothetical protein